ncbi:SurA N-terminal domain-containing protein [Alkalihalophilus lindianensis]|uniref:SurA N-terminal domain-containing protein n=1 Tax=Alkalihalophilus lindianensis TaxID=1630542 RepID=A0ABU3X7N5_9BACI|nr:SurA N-terminal domain-containing protein [Alkalihalophilus lindianensis]MDV2683903.1 SurA N-terminal domain-containing protein [Alkalihalophilus lindianensis]
MKKKLGLGMAAIALAITLAACGDNEETEVETEQPTEETTDEAAEHPETEEPSELSLDTEDIPEVVATVNGEDINKDDYVNALESQAMMYSQFGIDFSDEEGQAMLEELKTVILDGLIDDRLLIQAAEDVEVSEEEVNAELEMAMQQAQIGSEEELEQLLEEQGFTVDDIREDFERQIKVQKYIEGQTEAPEISEEELQTAYDQQVEMAEEAGAEEIPSFEEQRDTIEAELVQEAQMAQRDQIVAELREESDIETNV